MHYGYSTFFHKTLEKLKPSQEVFLSVFRVGVLYKDKGYKYDEKHNLQPKSES